MSDTGVLARFPARPGAEPIRDAVVRFLDENEARLARVVEQCRTEGTLRFEGLARETARTLAGGLEGAMLLARPAGDLARFETDARRLLARLASAAS